MLHDIINGSFELIAGILLMANVWKLSKDKEVKGVYWLPVAYFALWGYWNLVYYPHLGQWWSFAGGVTVVVANTIWAVLALYYMRKNKKMTNKELAEKLVLLAKKDKP